MRFKETKFIENDAHLKTQNYEKALNDTVLIFKTLP